MRWLLGTAAVLALLAAGLVAREIYLDRQLDRQYVVRIVAPARLLAEPDLKEGPSNRVVSVLSPGTPVQVLRVYYTKEDLTFEVRSSSGETGWLIMGDELKVSGPGFKSPEH